jgi:nucleotide-binding universal stress UspA family protein
VLPPKLILSPIDFSEHSSSALDVAAGMASRVGAELLLVHVVPAIPDLPTSVSILKEGEYENTLHDNAVQRLAELADALAKKNLKVRSEVGTANDVGMELVRIAEHNHVDLIIIATHGMTGWREIAFGSVAEEVVKNAGCAVLILRAKAAGDAADKDKTTSAAAPAAH